MNDICHDSLIPMDGIRSRWSCCPSTNNRTQDGFLTSGLIVGSLGALITIESLSNMIRSERKLKQRDPNNKDLGGISSGREKYISTTSCE